MSIRALSRLHCRPAAFDRGTGSPELTPADIAAALGMCAPGLGRDLLAVLWCPGAMADEARARVSRALAGLTVRAYEDALRTGPRRLAGRHEKGVPGTISGGNVSGRRRGEKGACTGESRPGARTGEGGPPLPSPSRHEVPDRVVLHTQVVSANPWYDKTGSAGELRVERTENDLAEIAAAEMERERLKLRETSATLARLPGVVLAGLCCEERCRACGGRGVKAARVSRREVAGRWVDAWEVAGKPVRRWVTAVAVVEGESARDTSECEACGGAGRVGRAEAEVVADAGCGWAEWREVWGGVYERVKGAAEGWMVEARGELRGRLAG